MTPDPQLTEIFKLQGDFSLLVRNLKEARNVARDEEDMVRLVDWSRTYILAAHAELSEMLDTVPSWKPHRRSIVEQPFNRDAFIEEGVDVFNYLLSALLLSGISAEEFYTIWRGKLDVLNQRLYQEVLDPLQPGQRVVMLDIDGVLADWRSGLIRFMAEDLGHAHLLGVTDQASVYQLDQDLQVSPEDYRTAKEEFHRRGGLRTLPRMAWARKLVQFACNAGRVVVLTSRPDDDRQVYRDTLYWLRNLFGEQPFILHFTRDKAVWLERARVDLVAAVEDEPDMAVRLALQFDARDQTPRVLVPDYPYNHEITSRIVADRYYRGPMSSIASKLEALSFKDPEEEVV